MEIQRLTHLQTLLTHAMQRVPCPALHDHRTVGALDHCS